MSCAAAFDWRALVAHRLDAHLDEPAEWPQAVAHFGGCPECRRAALAADPTLVFLRLGEEREDRRGPAGDSARDQAEIERVRAAVAGMRAASRVERSRRPSRLAHWKRWAGAAGLATVALTTGQRAELSGGVPVAEVPFAAVPADTAHLPIVEDVERFDGRLHVSAAPGISNIMFYDDKFEELGELDV